ncbi:MAG: hypothetical protein KJO69_09675 [Gammaproteobacteria bacterium]|nr:hypothetical protein [Gammaproteobacteria bacterium]
MEKDTLFHYGKVIGSIFAGAFLVYTSVVNLDMASNKNARPDAFGRTDFNREIASFKSELRAEITEVRNDLDRCRKNTQRITDKISGRVLVLEEWRNYHMEWGNKIRASDERWKGQMETNINFLMQRN